MLIEKIDPKNLDKNSKESLIDFLYEHLGQFRDPKDQIEKCFQYANDPQKGGQIYWAKENQELLGLTIILNTCMEGFLPPYFLVYIAVDQKTRGQGIGGKLIDFAQKDLGKPICLHVEHDNPAKRLYERKGFTSKYAEMRWQQ